MHLRIPNWFQGLTTICAMALIVLVVLPATPPGWNDVLTKINERRIKQFLSAKGVRKHIPAVEFYYLSRTYGNPGVNIELERYKTMREVEGRLNKGFDKTTESNVWVSIGPANIAGRVRAIAFRPDNPSVVYAGGASGGIFKSTNGGDGDWRPIMDFTDAIPVGAIAIDPLNPDIIYAGTGEPTADLNKVNSGPAYSGVGVFKSTDAGESWTRLPWPQQTSAIHRILIDPRNSQIVLVASRSHLWRSEDGGQNWDRSQTGVITDLQFQPGNPDIVYAAVGKDDGAVVNGVYRSNGNGKGSTWTKLTSNFPKTDSLGRIALAVTPANPNLLMAFVVRRGFQIGDNDFLAVMKSTNAGDSWSRMSSNLPSTFTNGQGFYDLCASISPTSADTIHAGGLQLWRSGNGGASWTQISRDNSPHVDQHVLEYSPDNKYLYLGNDGGVYRSLNKGVTWTPLGKTLETIQFYTVALDATNTNRFYGGVQDHGVFQATNIGTREWNIRRGGDGGYVVVDPNNPNIIYSRLMIDGPDFPVPARTSNGGVSWTRLDNGFSGDRYNWLPPMMLAPNDRTRMFTATQFVYSAKPVDSGNPRWNVISPDLTNGNSISSVISTIDICEAAPNTMYVGCGDGAVKYATNITAADVEWKDAANGLLPNRWVTRVKVDHRNAAIAYAVFSGLDTPHVYKTTDFGASWTDISGNLPNIPVNGIVISRDDPDNVLYVGTDIGLWYTRDAGQNWSRFGSGLPNVVVYDLAIDRQNRLIAATFGRGMWITTATLSASVAATPDAFSLRQNYPNPLSSIDGTTIGFTLKEAAGISLKLYDASGRMLRILREERLAGGSHSIKINTSDLRNGVYFYAISDGRNSSMKKMVVLN